MRFPISALQNGFEFVFKEKSLPKDNLLSLRLENALYKAGVFSFLKSYQKKKTKEKAKKFLHFTEEFYKHEHSLEKLRRLIQEFK